MHAIKARYGILSGHGAARYQICAARAVRAVARFGAPLTLVRRQDAGPFDPVTGACPQTETRTNLMGITRHSAARGEGGGSFAGGTLRVVLAAGGQPGCGLVPRPADSLLAGSATWTVTTVTTIAPGTVPVAFVVEARYCGPAENPQEQEPVTEVL